MIFPPISEGILAPTGRAHVRAETGQVINLRRSVTLATRWRVGHSERVVPRKWGYRKADEPTTTAWMWPDACGSLGCLVVRAGAGVAVFHAVRKLSTRLVRKSSSRANQSSLLARWKSGSNGFVYVGVRVAPSVAQFKSTILSSWALSDNALCWRVLRSSEW